MLGGDEGRAGVPSRVLEAMIRALCRQRRWASWDIQQLSIVRFHKHRDPGGEKTTHYALIRQGAQPQAKMRLQSFWALPHL